MALSLFRNNSRVYFLGCGSWVRIPAGSLRGHRKMALSLFRSNSRVYFLGCGSWVRIPAGSLRGHRKMALSLFRSNSRVYFLGCGSWVRTSEPYPRVLYGTAEYIPVDSRSAFILHLRVSALTLDPSPLTLRRRRYFVGQRRPVCQDYLVTLQNIHAKKMAT